jgi:hypothetical protein
LTGWREELLLPLSLPLLPQAHWQQQRLLLP